MSAKRILLIEDDRFFAQAYEEFLRVFGFDILYGSTGEEGLALALEQQPDLIVLDIALPKKDGFQVLQELKENEKTKKIPVIMLTNLSTKEDIDRCFQLGAREYLIKSHHPPEDLGFHIERILSSSGKTGNKK